MRQLTIQPSGMKKIKGNDEYEILLEQIKSYKKIMESFVIRIKKISRCRICNSKNLNKILKIKNMPFTDQFLLKKVLEMNLKKI